MTPYMGCSSRYGIPHIAKTPPYLSQTTSSENSKAIVPSHAAENASHPINSVSSQCLLPGEPLKRRRSRRGRTRDYYAKAIAAFSTIYPKVFSGPGGVCPLVKIKPGSPTEEAELLQELPALISPLKQADYEVPVLLSKFPNEYDSPSSPQAEMPTWNSAMPARNSGSRRQASESPGFDPQAEEDSCVVPEECVVVESLLDSNNSLPDGDGGLDGIMGGAGDSNSVPGDTSSPAGVFGDYGDREHLADERSYYYSAIRALRRRQWHTDCCRGDDVASAHVAPWSMSLADKIKAEKEMNTMSFCSLDWLKRDGQHGLSLKLNYEEILSAWSDRGSLYIDEQSPQTVPGGDDDDAVDSAMASVDVGLVPHLNLWRVEGENVIECSHRAEDGCAVEDGTKTGMREARVLRYREKRQTRLFSRKIRYQVRKINAERRPRMKVCLQLCLKLVNYLVYVDCYGFCKHSKWTRMQSCIKKGPHTALNVRLQMVINALGSLKSSRSICFELLLSKS